MKIQATPISGIMLVETNSYIDSRGAFARLFCAKELADLIGNRQIVQINHSRTSTLGAIRGMHFQHPPYAEMKVVRCIRGRVWDVAVDLKANSPTFLQWHAEELTPENARAMVIPEGFAHGFQVLEPESELLYLHTAFYTPEAEGGVRYDDPAINIRWPLAVTDISPRDKDHQLITPGFHGIRI